MKPSRCLILFCCLFIAIGCGDDRPPMVSVTGKVMLNGQGVTAGSIFFHPDSANSFQKDTPSSQLQLDGSFTIKTFPYGDGVPPGKYKVTLAPELANRTKHPSYGLVDKTPWEITVPEQGLSDHVFEVK